MPAGVHDVLDPLPKRVLVTGAAGFIGSHLSEALVAAGCEVVGIDGFVDSYPREYKERNVSALRTQERFTFGEVDLRSDPLEQWVDGVDVVVNEAGYAGLARSWTDMTAYLSSNVLGLDRLLVAARRAGVGRFVQISTSSVYGAYALGDEDAPTQPISPYGISKLAAEHLALAHMRADDLPVVILRYFSIYGPRQRPDMAYHIFIEALRRGLPLHVFGDGAQARSNTYVDDCVAGTIAAVNRAKVGGIYNIGGGELIELNAAIDLIGDLLGVVPDVRYGPGRTGDQRLTRADTSKARDAFGYVPAVRPSDGLSRQVRWHLAHLVHPDAPPAAGDSSRSRSISIPETIP